MNALIRLLREVSNAALALSTLGLIVAVVTDTSRLLVGMAAITVAANIYNMLMSRRSARADRETGMWDERTYVIDSMFEASRRDMRLTEWAEGYLERIKVDANL